METTAPSTSMAVAVEEAEKHEVSSNDDSNVKQSPTASLSEQEKEIIDRQTSAPNLTVGYFSLFRYASTKEKLIMVIAFIASVGAGATMPLMTVRYFYIPIHQTRILPSAGE